MTAYSTFPAGTPLLAMTSVRTELQLAQSSRFAAWSAALVIGYFALDFASFMFRVDPVPVKTWGPQAGLAIAFVYAGGLRYCVPLFVAAWLCEALFRHPGMPMLQVVAAVAVTTALTLSGLAVRRRTRGKDFTGIESLRDFLVIAAAGAALSSFLYVGAYSLLTPGAFPGFLASVLHTWLGDFAGIVAVAPLVVLLVSPRALVGPVGKSAWIDAVGFLLTLAALFTLLFWVEPGTGERLLYLLFVPLVVLAMRRGFAGAALGIATVQVAMVASLWLAGRSVDAATDYQMLMVVLGITTLVLGAVAGERRRAIAELAQRSAELRAQQQALSDAMRGFAASETASTLTHEMSQPLSAIGTYAHAMVEMLRRGTSSPAQLAGIMECIVAESARTRETVHRIRDFFRSGAPRRESVDVATLVDDVVDALRDRMRANGIVIAADIPGGTPPVSADRVQLGIVLHNLVGNAADAVVNGLPPRWIRISAREHGGFVEVDVADGGTGIDPDVEGALFEPLATTKPAGMGLGLSISRTLILAHGGRLELASVHPTTFRFALPIHANIRQ